MSRVPKLPAPFPWFGGKSRAAELVWARFGNVPNYVEPFAGSLAVLLGRPTAPQLETVNDFDCYLANFWRAVQATPEAVAEWADAPVNEADLLARHKWLLAQTDFRERMKTDPHFFDAKNAGWWVWGVCAWIGDGWCVAEKQQLPHLGDSGQGVHRKLPHLGDSGQGVHRKLPHLSSGRGVHRKLPHLGDGMGERLVPWFRALQTRLRNVRVACGEWERVLGESVTWKHGVTGVFLDPPYSDGNQQYSAGGTGTDIEGAVREWAVSNGANPLLRIALCGYDGNHGMPKSWECVAWKAAGGMGSQGDGDGRANKNRERIWFSPHCLRANTLEFAP